MQQHYSVSLTLPLSLAATSTAEAQTQADALTTGSNASGALAAALSAGLTSGEPVVRTPVFPAVVFCCKCATMEAAVRAAVTCC